MPAGLLSLPVEVLQLIIELLCPHCTAAEAKKTSKRGPPKRNGKTWRRALLNIQSMRGICYSSRLLRAVATPFLYHRVDIRSTLRDELFPLARFFCERPDLALEAREIAINPSSPPVSKLALFSEEDIEFIRREHARASYALPPISQPSSVVGDITAEREKVWRLVHTQNSILGPLLVDLLLSKTPNVEDLNIALHASEPAGKHLAPGVRFSNLHALDIGGDDYEARSKPLHLSTYTQLLRSTPNVSYLRVRLCVDLWKTLEVQLDSIRFLHLAHSKLSFRAICGLIRACPILESFRYSSQWFYDEEDPDNDGFTGRELCRALRPLKATLKHLDVNLNPVTLSQEREVMDDLTGNTALELICLHVNCVWGGYPHHEEDSEEEDLDADDELEREHSTLVRLLPTSATSLSLDGLSDYYYPHLRQLAEATRSGLFPNLQYFYFVPSSDADPNRLKDAFQGTNVKCSNGWLRGWGK